MIIVVAHQKGGVGKSTIASNLAVELAKTEAVTVVDLDMQKSMSYFNSVRIDSGKPKLEVIFVDNFNNLKNLINDSKETLIIDVGGFDSDLNRVAILGADVIITPVSDSAIELVGLLSFKNTLDAINEIRPELKASILLNRIHASAKTSLVKLAEFVNGNDQFELLDTIFRDRVEFKKAFENGLSVNELKPKSKAAEEVTNLIKEIKHGKN
jgi:chromosome partitioning protein